MEIIVRGWVIVQFLSLLGRRARLSLPAVVMAEWLLQFLTAAVNDKHE